MFLDDPTEEEEVRLAEVRKREEKLRKTRQNFEDRIKEKNGGRPFTTGNRRPLRRTGVRSIRS